MKDDRGTAYYNLDHMFGEAGALCFPGPRDIAVERLDLLGGRQVRPSPLLRRQNANMASSHAREQFIAATAGIFFPPVPFFLFEEDSDEEMGEN